jgi:hypothetical protein
MLLWGHGNDNVRDVEVNVWCESWASDISAPSEQ